MMKTFGGWFRTLRNIQSDAENGYYIIGSYQKILFIGCIYWGALIVLLASTTIVTSILTIPILAYSAFSAAPETVKAMHGILRHNII